MTESIWTKDVTLPSFPPLSEDASVDVLIIGGGMTGLLCTYFLTQAGMNCLLCEADTIASGTTGGTTAVISARHGSLYGSLMKKYGYTKTRLYLEANLRAVSSYRTLAEQFPCDFLEISSSLYSCTNAELMAAEVKALHGLGYNALLKKSIPFPVPALAAVEFPAQAQFHPLKFIAGLSQNLPIREHTMITRMDKNSAYTKDCRITAKKIIVASHFPFWDNYGLYFAKLYQKRSYVLALKGAGIDTGSYSDYKQGGLSFRSYGDTLLVSGGSHHTGCRKDGYEILRRFANEHYRDCTESFHWSAQDCMSLDGIPYIGLYSPRTPKLYTATGYNAWGMTSSMVAAQILTDLILGRGNKYAETFSPSRSIWHPQLFENMGNSLLHLLVPSRFRCPHMGCAMRWNPTEHTWDCPCHGSRFAKDGTLMRNPALHNLNVKKDP